MSFKKRKKAKKEPCEGCENNSGEMCNRYSKAECCVFCFFHNDWVRLISVGNECANAVYYAQDPTETATIAA